MKKDSFKKFETLPDKLRRKLLKKLLAKESKMVSKSSMEVLKEFEILDDTHK